MKPQRRFEQPGMNAVTFGRTTVELFAKFLRQLSFVVALCAVVA
jgi:hypothetical protein